MPDFDDDDRDVTLHMGQPEEVPKWLAMIPQGFAGIILGQRPLMGGPAAAEDERAARRFLISLITIVASLGLFFGSPLSTGWRIVILAAIAGAALGVESWLEARQERQISSAVERSRRKLLESRARGVGDSALSRIEPDAEPTDREISRHS